MKQFSHKIFDLFDSQIFRNSYVENFKNNMENG